MLLVAVASENVDLGDCEFAERVGQGTGRRACLEGMGKIVLSMHRCNGDESKIQAAQMKS